MPIKAERDGAPECQRREIKIPRKRACRGSDQVTDEVLRLVSVIRGQMSRSEIQVLLGLRHLPHLRNAYLKPGIQHGLFEHQRNDFAIHDFADQRLFTRYEPPVTRYSCDSPSPLHVCHSTISAPLSVLPAFSPSHLPLSTFHLPKSPASALAVFYGNVKI